MIKYLPQTESTNLSLRSIADTENPANLSIVWTDYQTKGRGQPGNSWESAAGMNLLCSILYYPPDIPASRSFTLLEMTALSVKHTLDKYIPDVSIKWPNDIYYQDQKISGILIENDIANDKISRSIIGIGINLNQTTFVSDAPNPVSLSMITGHTYNIQTILNQLHTNFKQLTGELEHKGFDYLHPKYCASQYRHSGFYRYKDAAGYFDASIQTIEPSGHLILKRQDGTLSRYGFKEVKYNG